MKIETHQTTEFTWVIWILSDFKMNWFKKPKMQIEAIQINLSRVNLKVREFYWSIQGNLTRFMHDIILNIMRRLIPSQRLLMIRFRLEWIDLNSWKKYYTCKNVIQDTRNICDMDCWVLSQDFMLNC